MREVIHDALDEHTATITVDELAEIEELTSEEEFAAALDREHEWHLGPDDALLDGPPDAWTLRGR